MIGRTDEVTSSRRIVLGVAGGIAAYKACELLRRLTEAGHDVTVVPTAAALNFVGATTWAALSGHPVHTEVFDDADVVSHVQLGQSADLVVVAPATADLLARAASGRADDLLTNVLLTARGTVLMAPAMHTEMWCHPATVANVATLRARGVVVLDPASGRLTGADSGPGRLPDASDIAAVAESLLDDPDRAVRASAGDLRGRTITISAGGTRESLDPVRYLGNASSGRMGVALARSAALRGARVRLVAAHLEVPVPSGVAEVVTIGSTAELAEVMRAAQTDSDVLVMAAAVADFTPSDAADTKIKKSGDAGLSIDLVQTTDVLRRLVQERTRADQLIIGFAAETPTAGHSLRELGHAKLGRKGCDLLVLNDVSGGGVFGAPDNEILLIDQDSEDGPWTGSKESLAHRVWDRVGTLFESRPTATMPPAPRLN